MRFDTPSSAPPVTQRSMLRNPMTSKRLEFSVLYVAWCGESDTNIEPSEGFTVGRKPGQVLHCNGHHNSLLSFNG